MKLTFTEEGIGDHLADDRYHHYRVWGGGNEWHVTVKLRFHRNGLRTDLATEPVLAHGTAPSLDRARWTASEFSGLGRDYEPRAHAGRSRMDEAARRVRKREHVLTFRKVSPGRYQARSPHLDYLIVKHDKHWTVRINRLVVTAGVTHCLGDTFVAQGHHTTKTLCVLTARHFHWLGEGYQPHEHGHRGRYTEASLRAYAEERARWEAADPDAAARLKLAGA